MNESMSNPVYGLSWTPQMLTKLGYNNDPDLTKIYLPDYKSMAFGPEQFFIKVWKDNKRGINNLSH